MVKWTSVVAVKGSVRAATEDSIGESTARELSRWFGKLCMDEPHEIVRIESLVPEVLVKLARMFNPF